MRLIGTLFALCCAASSVCAVDLFYGGKPTQLEKGSEVVAPTTIGGYPIFYEAGTWRLISMSNAMSNTNGSADAINHGQVAMLQVDPTGVVVGSMAVLVNLSSTGQNQFVSGTPCTGTHMVVVNKGGGLYDNCLTIDVNSFEPSQPEATYFDIRITQSRSGGRLYIVELRLLSSVFGFRGTKMLDWQTDAVQASAEKTAFVDRLKAWSVLLQDASDRAIAFSKPADAFSAVPSYRTLINNTP